MTQEKTFRARAKFVRHAARVNLLEIRRTRLAKKKGPLPYSEPGDIGSPKAEFDQLLLGKVLPKSQAVVRIPLVSNGETEPLIVTDTALVLAGEGLLQAVDSDLVLFVDTTIAEPPQDFVLSNNGTESTLQVALAKPKRKTTTTTANKRPKNPKTINSDLNPDALIAMIEDNVVLHAAMENLKDEHDQNTLPDPSSLAEPEREYENPRTAADSSLCAPADAHSISGVLTEFEALPLTSVAETRGLQALPGAGPGLIWMLGTAGIWTMDDLADADADVLGARLGLVGQILNVGSWVDFARDLRRANAGVSRLTHFPSL